MPQSRALTTRNGRPAVLMLVACIMVTDVASKKCDSDNTFQCSCHAKSCPVFNDCCKEVFSEATPLAEGPPTYQCVWKPLSWEIEKSQTKVQQLLVVDSCPQKSPNISRQIVSKCGLKGDPQQKLIGRIPVYDSRGVIFKNFFCALCNGVAQATFPKCIVSCAKEQSAGLRNTSAEDLYEQKSCLRTLLFPTDAVRAHVCDKSRPVSDRCPGDASTSAHHTCRQAPQVLHQSTCTKRLYRNRACASCAEPHCANFVAATPPQPLPPSIRSKLPTGTILLIHHT